MLATISCFANSAAAYAAYRAHQEGVPWGIIIIVGLVIGVIYAWNKNNP